MGWTPMKRGVLHVELSMKSSAKNHNLFNRFKWEHQRIGSSKQKTSRPVIRQEVFLIVTV